MANPSTEYELSSHSSDISRGVKFKIGLVYVCFMTLASVILEIRLGPDHAPFRNGFPGWDLWSTYVLILCLTILVEHQLHCASKKDL